MIESTQSVADLFSQLGIATQPVVEPTDGGLTQADFLRLLTTELRYQDPTSPLDSKEFLGQIAQFTTVDGIQGMETALAAMTAAMEQAQILQAASLIGHRALVPGGQFLVDGDANVAGKIDLPVATPDLELVIQDGVGGIVRVIELGAQQAGQVDFDWDGKTGAGAPVVPGVYQITARYQVGDHKDFAATLLWAEVDSISASANGAIELNLLGMPSVTLAEVNEFS